MSIFTDVFSSLKSVQRRQRRPSFAPLFAQFRVSSNDVA